MGLKQKVLFLGVFLGALTFFRYEIASYFKLEHLLTTQGQQQNALFKPQAGGVLPPVGIIASKATIYRKKGSGAIAHGKAGDEISVLDAQDKGQRYIAIRYNGISGYINRGDITFKTNQGSEPNE